MASKENRFLKDAERARLTEEIQDGSEDVVSTEDEQQKKQKKRKTRSVDTATAATTSEVARRDARVHKHKHNDGMEELVSALPRSFSSRFGEICWAHGGTGYGWWPSCIYDPRLIAVGNSTRVLALKNLGRKHLVYFFQCGVTSNETPPFDLLPDSKILPWHQGLAEGLYLGRTAKATGRHRFTRFREALQAAVIEQGKPQSKRLVWNSPRGGEGEEKTEQGQQTPQVNNGLTFLPSPIRLVASAKKNKTKQENKVTQQQQQQRRQQQQQQSRVKPVLSGRQPRIRAHRTIDFGAVVDGDSITSAAAAAAAAAAVREEQQQSTNDEDDCKTATTPNRSNRERDQRGRYAPFSPSADKGRRAPHQTRSTSVAAHENEAAASSSPSDAQRPLSMPDSLSSSSAFPMPMEATYTAATADERECYYCQIYFTDNPTNIGSTTTTCVGFIEMPRLDCTFTDVRSLIQDNLETEKFPHSDWRFVHPTLGPLSIRMEISNKGPMIPYLRRGTAKRGGRGEGGGTDNGNMGDGSIENPFKVTICQDPLSLMALASPSPLKTTSG